MLGFSSHHPQLRTMILFPLFAVTISMLHVEAAKISSTSNNTPAFENVPIPDQYAYKCNISGLQNENMTGHCHDVYFLRRRFHTATFKVTTAFTRDVVNLLTDNGQDSNNQHYETSFYLNSDCFPLPADQHGQWFKMTVYVVSAPWLMLEIGFKGGICQQACKFHYYQQDAAAVQTVSVIPYHEKFFIVNPLNLTPVASSHIADVDESKILYRVDTCLHNLTPTFKKSPHNNNADHCDCNRFIYGYVFIFIVIAFIAGILILAVSFKVTKCRTDASSSPASL